MKKKLIFTFVFIILGFLALQVPFTQLVGSKVKFTLFDFFGPIASGFLGGGLGVLSVALMQLVNWLVHGLKTDVGTIIRFFPMLLATWYFARRSKFILIVPIIAIIAFIAHPIGRQVWYFSLFWTIPLLAHFLRDRWLFLRALGTTFTAHAVGGALWIWNFNLRAEVWQGLIPIVIIERLLFAGGITVTYLAFTWLLDYLIKKGWLKLNFITLEKRLLFFKNKT